MPFEVFLTFLGACTLLFLKPGPSMSIIVANSAGYGVRGGLVSVAGNVLGCLILVTIVALGLAWIAEAMESWFKWIKWGGGLYLIWLGIGRLRKAGEVQASKINPAGEQFREGFVVALANPEVILFLAAFLPPFVDPARPAAPQFAILGAGFVVVAAAAGCLLAVMAGQARNFLSGDRLKWIDYVSGGLLVLGGLWLAWPR